jgi:hypothetical protein
LLSYVNDFGGIVFQEPIVGSGNNFSVIVSDNFASVDSVNNPGFNKPARITLLNLLTDFTSPRIVRDGEDCPSTICQNLTSLNSGTAIFDVSSWTSYSVAGIELISPEVNILLPSDGISYNSYDSPLDFNVNLNEIGFVDYSLNGGTNNYSMDTSDGYDFSASSGLLEPGDYVFNAYATDLVGNINNSQSSNFTIMRNPVRIIVPLYGGNYNQSIFPLEFKVIIDKDGEVEYSLNNGTTNASMFSLDNRTFTKNISILSIGDYSFKVYANLTQTGEYFEKFSNFEVIAGGGPSSGVPGPGPGPGGDDPATNDTGDPNTDQNITDEGGNETGGASDEGIITTGTVAIIFVISLIVILIGLIIFFIVKSLSKKKRRDIRPAIRPGQSNIRYRPPATTFRRV